MKKYTVDELKGPGARVYEPTRSPDRNSLLAAIYGLAQSQMYHFRVYRDDARKAMERGDHKQAVEWGMKATYYRVLAYNTTRPVRDEFQRVMTMRKMYNGKSGKVTIMIDENYVDE